MGLLPNSSVGTGPFHRGRSWDINALVSVGIALGTGREPLLERMSLLDGQLRGWVELLRCARSSGQHEINSTLRVVSVSTKKEVSGTRSARKDRRSPKASPVQRLFTYSEFSSIQEASTLFSDLIL